MDTCEEKSQEDLLKVKSIKVFIDDGQGFVLERDAKGKFQCSVCSKRRRNLLKFKRHLTNQHNACSLDYTPELEILTIPSKRQRFHFDQSLLRVPKESSDYSRESSPLSSPTKDISQSTVLPSPSFPAPESSA